MLVARPKQADESYINAENNTSHTSVFADFPRLGMVNITNFPQKLVLEPPIGISNGVVEDMKAKALLKMELCAPRLHPRSFL